MIKDQVKRTTSVSTITVDDMQVRVSGNGFPLILLHGFTTTSEFWRERVEDFSASYRVIRPNLPGHGISGSPATRKYTIEAFVEDIEQLFRYFSFSQAALVGLSMGGIIAQHIAARTRNCLNRSYLLIRRLMALDKSGELRMFSRLLTISVLKEPFRSSRRAPLARAHRQPW
jgi:pimeloyl-ACP methyl ester carboxylesterase